MVFGEEGNAEGSEEGGEVPMKQVGGKVKRRRLTSSTDGGEKKKKIASDPVGAECELHRDWLVLHGDTA